MTIEKQAEDIVRQMASESWNESIETIANLLRELEAARKVADAAVAWLIARDEYLQTHNIESVLHGDVDKTSRTLTDAVREYRQRAESLSSAKQAVVDAALEKLDDEKAIEEILICKCGHSINMHGLPKGCRVSDCPCWSFRVEA